MKAIVYHRYGQPLDVLKYEEVDKPVPADDEVSIAVRAASVNPYDWHFIFGTPFLLRLMSGLREPRRPTPGVDVAGVVDAVGKNVTGLKPGDAVFGWCKRGSLAEYTCTPPSMLALKPENVSFEQAATLAIAGMTALQALRDRARVQPGQRVLINGASGGIGTFAVQIAKSLGATVTGVCSTRNLEMVRSIGADRVIDYTQEDLTRGSERYDVIIDLVGTHSFTAYRRVLKPKGMVVPIGGGGTAGRDFGPWFRRFLFELLWSPFVSQKLAPLLARGRKEDLTALGELVSAGTVTPVIDRRYPLTAGAEAFQYLAEGHARGKVVVTVAT